MTNERIALEEFSSFSQCIQEEKLIGGERFVGQRIPVLCIYIELFFHNIHRDVLCHNSSAKGFILVDSPLKADFVKERPAVELVPCGDNHTVFIVAHVKEAGKLQRGFATIDRWVYILPFDYLPTIRKLILPLTHAEIDIVIQKFVQHLFIHVFQNIVIAVNECNILSVCCI